MRKIVFVALVVLVVMAGCEGPAALPEPIPGHTTDLLETTTDTKHWLPDEADDAAFRTFCGRASYATADPLIAPGIPTFAHLHQFFGAGGVDHNSDLDTLVADTTESTCNGGLLNRTAYWTPTIQTWGTPVEPSALSVYYKKGKQGVARLDIGWFPAGLRIVAGNAHATAPQDFDIVHYTCLTGGGSVLAEGNTIPECGPGRRLSMSVVFPQCWDGVNDWLPGSAHMAYGLGTIYPPSGPPEPQGCPASHPGELPEITTNVLYDITGDISSWHLSSDEDHQDALPGQTGHSDWVNGWDPTIGQSIINFCFRAAGTEADPVDCRADLFAPGLILGG